MPACDSAALAARRLRPDPHVRERVRPPPRGADELLLGHQRRALGALLLAGRDGGAQALDLGDDLGGRPRVGGAERDLLDGGRSGVSLAGLETRARAEGDADVGVVAWFLRRGEEREREGVSFCFETSLPLSLDLEKQKPGTKKAKKKENSLSPSCECIAFLTVRMCRGSVEP